MKAKKVLFLIVSFVVISFMLYFLMNFAGVQVTGPKWGQLVFFICTGFAGVVLWEFYGSVS